MKNQQSLNSELADSFHVIFLSIAVGSCSGQPYKKSYDHNLKKLNKSSVMFLLVPKSIFFLCSWLR